MIIIDLAQHDSIHSTQHFSQRITIHYKDEVTEILFVSLAVYIFVTMNDGNAYVSWKFHSKLTAACFPAVCLLLWQGK
jgi:hypothetical protein